MKSFLAIVTDLADFFAALPALDVVLLFAELYINKAIKSDPQWNVTVVKGIRALRG